MADMNGMDWAILIIIVILTVLLSTISKWWGQFVWAVGKTLAISLISAIIAILLITLITLMALNPNWFDKASDLLYRQVDKGIDAANAAVNTLMKGAVKTTLEVFLPYLIISGVGFFAYKLLFKENRGIKKDQNVKIVP